MRNTSEDSELEFERKGDKFEVSIIKGEYPNREPGEYAEMRISDAQAMGLLMYLMKHLGFNLT